MKKITEATAVSLSLVVILAGGIFWLSSLYANVNASNVKIQKLEVQQEQTAKDVIDRLARIEEQLKHLSKKRE